MIRFRVNGTERAFDGDPEMPVLWYLRDVLGLTETKFGCGIALCGACTVHQNGQPIRSCVVPVRVVDAGTAVNPANIKAQFEGAAVFGTSTARGCEITASDGVINQSNFNDYPVARIHQAPYQTNVYVVESTAPPEGVGEPGVSVIPPARCNAIFAATGKRIRELPLSNSRLS